MKTETEQLDRTSEIANEQMAKFEAEAKERDQGSKEESKGASSDKSSTEKNQTEGTKKEETNEGEAEGTSKNDEQILESNDGDLNEEELIRKGEIVKERDEARTPEQKLADFQENTQKRIDGVLGELKEAKSSRESDQATIKALEDKIANLTGELEESGSIESDVVKLKNTAEESYAKMVETDKDLPRNERREMSEDELEDYLLEDYSKANQWLVRRELRRDRDLQKQMNAKESNEKASESIAKSAEALFTKYPKCDQEARGEELMKEGKSEKEAIEIVMKESPDFKLMMDILKEDKKYSDPKDPKAPLLLMEEMEKRIGGTSKTYTEDEVKTMKEEAIEAERKRIESIDTGAGGNNLPAQSFETSLEDPLVQAQWKEWQKASKRPGARGDWSQKEFLKTLKYGETQRKASPL